MEKSHNTCEPTCSLALHPLPSVPFVFVGCPLRVSADLSHVDLLLSLLQSVRVSLERVRLARIVCVRVNILLRVGGARCAWRPRVGRHTSVSGALACRGCRLARVASAHATSVRVRVRARCTTMPVRMTISHLVLLFVACVCAPGRVHRADGVQRAADCSSGGLRRVAPNEPTTMPTSSRQEQRRDTREKVGEDACVCG